jgi:preprotein translocase subunit YajC
MYLLQAATGGSSFMPFFFVAMILVFWLFFIRPQAKKQKQQKTFIDNLQKGDKVVTIAGIHGKVNRVNEDGTIDVEITPGLSVKMEKSSVSMEMSNQLNKPATQPAKK